RRAGARGQERGGARAEHGQDRAAADRAAANAFEMHPILLGDGRHHTRAGAGRLSAPWVAPLSTIACMLFCSSAQASPAVRLPSQTSVRTLFISASPSP